MDTLACCWSPTVLVFTGSSPPTGLPDLDLSLATTAAAGMRVSVFTDPGGSGMSLDRCYVFGGAEVDATITLTLLDSAGDPVPDFPAEDLYLATSAGGLNRYDPQTETFIHYQHDPENPNSPVTDSLRGLFEDSRGNLWLGSLREGITRFNPETETFTQFPATEDALYGQTEEFAEDTAGNIWMSGYGDGLYKFNPETEEITIYRHNPDDPNSIPSNKGQCSVEVETRALR